MARRPNYLLMIAAASLVAAGPMAFGSAFAAAGDPPPKPMQRVLPAAKPAGQAPPRPRISPAPPFAAALPPVLASGAGLNAGSLASGGLASGGLHSTLPALDDREAQCRAACSHVRITCIAQDDSPECSPKWALCTAGCDR